MNRDREWWKNKISIQFNKASHRYIRLDLVGQVFMDEFTVPIAVHTFERMSVNCVGTNIHLPHDYIHVLYLKGN